MGNSPPRRRITRYYPSRAHATLSVTGTKCALNCRHCGGKYLKNMLDVSTRDRFRNVICRLRKRGMKGILLSGGCDLNGEIRFTHLAEEIRKVTDKGDPSGSPIPMYPRAHLTCLDVTRQALSGSDLTREGGFLVNVHTGFIGAEGARELHEMGVRNICIDVVGTRKTIENVYGLDVEDPGKALDALSEQGFTDIVPHITVGLEGGKLCHEAEALKLIKARLGEPKKIVFLSLIPTEGTAYQDVKPVGVREMLLVIGGGRSIFPGTELILGCMRPHYTEGEIIEMVDAGIDGIVNPSEKVKAELEGMAGESGSGVGFTCSIVEKTSCCSF